MAVTVERRKRKRGTSILLSYLDGEGKRRRKVVGTAETREALKPILEEADRQRKRIEHELAEGTLRPKLGEEGIEAALLEFVQHQAASSVRESTIRAYRETLQKWRAYLKTTDARRLKDITPRLIVGYVKSQNGKAPDTIKSDLTKLQRIFRHFVDREALAAIPSGTRPSERSSRRASSTSAPLRIWSFPASWRRSGSPVSRLTQRTS